MHGRMLTYTKSALKIGYDFESYLFKQISIELCNVPGTGGILKSSTVLEITHGRLGKERCSMPL